MILIVI